VRVADNFTTICEPIVWTMFFLYVDDVGTSQETHLWASTACYGVLYFLYAYDVRTSQGAWASTACYGNSFTFLYVDDVRTSQEAHASTADYWDSFAFYYITLLEV
jgi:hypothetical protein